MIVKAFLRYYGHPPMDRVPKSRGDCLWISNVVDDEARNHQNGLRNLNMAVIENMSV